ncbi:MAG: ABC transporter permease [Halobacteriota archaeon]
MSTVTNSVSRANELLSRWVRRYRGTRVGTALLLGPALVCIAFLVLVPALLLVRYSFYPFVDGQILDGFTLANYARIADIPLYLSVALRTIKLSIYVTIVAFLLAFPLAYAAVRTGGWLGRLIVLSAFAPLTIDVVIRSFGWHVLLSNDGLIQSFLVALPLVSAANPPKLLYNELAIVVGMTHIILPFVVFPIINVLHTIPPELEEAARDLGANRLTTIRLVVLPLALPGIVSGLLMGFLLTMASYVTPSILGGKIKVLPTIITTQVTTTNNWPFAGALSMILLVVAIVVIVGYHRAQLRMSGGSSE